MPPPPLSLAGMMITRTSPSRLAAPLAMVLAACPGDDGASPAMGSSGSTTAADSTTTNASTSTGPGSSSGGADTSSSGDGSGSSSSTSGDDTTTGPIIEDPGCPECTVLAVDLMGGRGLFVDADWVYFTDQTGGTVERVPKGGGARELLQEGQPEPYGVTATSEHVFWTTFVEGGSVVRANLPDGPPIALSADGFPRMIQLVGDHVYWCSFDDVEGRVRRVQAVGIGQPPETLVSVGSGVADLEVVGPLVYFTAHEPPPMPGLAPEGNVYVAASDVPTDPADVVLLAVEQAEPWGMAVGAGTVFWVNGDGNGNDQPLRLMSAPVDGTSNPTELQTDQVAPWGVAADDQYVYWTDFTEVRALPHRGGEPIVLAEQQNIGRAIVVDDDHVYWITRDRVLQRPKP
jgi:hypothetical protein